MKAQITIHNFKYEVDFSKGLDISIPLNFNGPQPNTYGVDKAHSKAYTDLNFVGDTRVGGPCNFETYTFTPHCNGTHTECIGHITNERTSILSSLNEEFIPSTLISMTTKKSSESYIPDLNEEDNIITKEEIKKCLEKTNPDFLKAVIIRTLPNSITKKSRNYMKENSCFFSIEAISYLVSLGVKHLLVDTPSIDRLFDDGHLIAHNIFWETEKKKLNPKSINKTITEMIYVADSINDGQYFLNLQIPPFVSDAAPSRPILYSINEL